jgi:hypothetical protein
MVYSGAKFEKQHYKEEANDAKISSLIQIRGKKN